MGLLCLWFMVFYINVSTALYRKEKAISVLNKLNDYGANKPAWNYFGRRNNDAIDKSFQYTSRDQTQDVIPHLGWLTLLRKNHHEDDQIHRFGQKAFKNRRKYTDESGRDSSTSMEMIRWKQQFDEDWEREKHKALEIKSKVPSNAVLNMAAARPWSLPCGDPMQHDQPWGTCTLSFQCMPSLRIYRGDFQCGQTHFICCGALFTHHDMYQGFEMSFIDTGSSSTGERARQAEKSGNRRKKKRRREKIRRWKNRKRSKKRLKRMIKRLSHEIMKNLHRAFRNTSMDRKYKVKNMKKTISMLKAKFREERLNLKIQVNKDIEAADNDLKITLTNVNNLNVQYLTNATFRGLLNTFNLTLKDIKILTRRLPIELKPYLLAAMKKPADARKFEEQATETVDYEVDETASPVNTSQETAPRVNTSPETAPPVNTYQETVPRVNTSPETAPPVNMSPETAPPVNTSRVTNESSVETDAYSGLDDKLSDNEETELDEITPVPPDNIVNESVTLPIETRRFVGGIIGAQRKTGNQRKREDYIDYDIEYGELYF